METLKVLIVSPAQKRQQLIADLCAEVGVSGVNVHRYLPHELVAHYKDSRRTHIVIFDAPYDTEPFDGVLLDLLRHDNPPELHIIALCRQAGKHAEDLYMSGADVVLDLGTTTVPWTEMLKYRLGQFVHEEACILE